MQSIRSLVVISLSAAGTCFVTLGLTLGGGTVLADASPAPDENICDVGRTACYVPSGSTCGPPQTCPKAGETHPTCNCG